MNMALMQDEAFLPASAELTLIKTLIMSNNYGDAAKETRILLSGIEERKKKVEIFSLDLAEIQKVHLKSPMCTLWWYLNTFISVFTCWVILFIIGPAHKNVYDGMTSWR